MHTHHLAMAALVVSACATTHDYVYSPHGATEWRDGYHAAIVAVPPESPLGTVELTSFGITELAAGDAAAIPVMHVRMAVSNSGDATPWTVGTETAMVEIPREGKARALFVNSDLPALPAATVEQHARRVFDFYFALPTTITRERELASFDFLWQVTTSVRPFEWRTTFTRNELVVEPVHSETVLVVGWGPYWWFNPMHTWPVFLHHPPIRVVRPPMRVLVTRPPAVHRRRPRR